MCGARAYAFPLSILGLLRTSLLTPSTCPSCLYAPEGSTEEATGVQDAGCMRQHAAKNSAAWQCRECLESFVRVWTDCPLRGNVHSGRHDREPGGERDAKLGRRGTFLPFVRGRQNRYTFAFVSLLAFVISVVGLSSEENTGINI